MAFQYLKDRPRGTVKHASTASTAYTIGQPVKLTNNVVVAAVSGDKIYGICKQAKAATDTSTDPLEVYPVRRDDVFKIDVGTGTMADSYVDTGTPVDLKSGAPTTIDLTASTNDDVELVGWDGSDTTVAYGKFTNTVS